MNPEPERLLHPTAEDLAAIVAPLDAASRSAGFAHDPHPITLVVRDSTGAIIGGVVGETNWGWLHTRILGVDPAHRSRGLGRALMAAIEQAARDQGCRHAWVDTFSFQARPFYERIGYRVFGQLPHYPDAETRFFLSRDL